MTTLAALLVIAAAVAAILRRAEVRLTLLLAALVLGLLAGQPMTIVQVFLEGFTNCGPLIHFGFISKPNPHRHLFRV